jgi:hypothetical protein
VSLHGGQDTHIVYLWTRQSSLDIHEASFLQYGHEKLNGKTQGNDDDRDEIESSSFFFLKKRRELTHLFISSVSGAWIYNSARTVRKSRR